MKAAIENFIHFPATDKVLLLGAMAELGSESIAEHDQIIEQIKKIPWKDVVLVGGDFLKTDHPFRSFSNAEEAGKWLASNNFQHTALLVKGSRSSQMERTIESMLKSKN
jgi:UDP-N-acetylmuramoyl-tripeptide--D-alanyl-D-alanine ligase